MEKPSAWAVFTGARPHPRSLTTAAQSLPSASGGTGPAIRSNCPRTARRRAPPSWPLGKGIRINGGFLPLDRGSSGMRMRPGQEPCPCSPLGPELQALCIRSQAPVLGKVEAVERMHRKTGKRWQGGQKPSASPLSPSNAALLPAAASAGRPSGASEGVLQPQIWPLPSRAVAMLPEFNHPVSSEEPGVPEGGRTLPTESPYSGSKADPSVPLLFRALTYHLPLVQPWTEPLHRPSPALGRPRAPRAPGACSEPSTAFPRGPAIVHLSSCLIPLGFIRRPASDGSRGQQGPEGRSGGA